MGSFQRSGTFTDRAKFLAGLKSKIANLKESALRGMDEAWTEGTPGTCTISGFGVKVLFAIHEHDWTCEATIPPWIPIPLGAVEERFDREFSELQGL